MGKAQFGEISGRSKDHPKSIAICPGALISHSGIINSPRKPQKYIKKPSTSKKNMCCCCIFGPEFSNNGPTAKQSCQIGQALVQDAFGAAGANTDHLRGTLCSTQKYGVYRAQNTAKKKSMFLMFLVFQYMFLSFYRF